MKQSRALAVKPVKKILPKQYSILNEYLSVVLANASKLNEKDQKRVERIKSRIDALKPINGGDQHWCVGLARAFHAGFYKTS